jgi:hypothetical protein
LEFLQRAAEKYLQLRLEEPRIQAEKNMIVVSIAKVQDTACIWPECEATPLPRSKWCSTHKHEHQKVGSRERQRQRRAKLSPG